jgi:hypothetical protein
VAARHSRPGDLFVYDKLKHWHTVGLTEP